MGNDYLVGRWAIVRRNELVDVPPKIRIHKDFLVDLSEEELGRAFLEVHDLFYQIYTDMAGEPERFGCPAYREDEYSYFSKEAREARSAPRNIFYFMMGLFYCGEFKERIFTVDMIKFKAVNKAKKVNCLLKVLGDYGFQFEGCKDFKITPSVKIMEIDYPDQRNVLTGLSLIAKKVMDIQLKDAKNYFSNEAAFRNGFISWNYKIIEEDSHICTLGEGCYYVADKMHKQSEREVIETINQMLSKKGFTSGRGDMNEGPSIRYYDKNKSVYDFALTSMEGKLLLELRIRNAERCMEYLKECPQRIADIFRASDEGCQNRRDGVCKYGVGYTFEGEEKWRCGCFSASFRVYPVKKDVAHYLRLVELGNRR